MNDKRIETYLRKSTRGLWGRKREEVREELSVHIQGRVTAHLIGGLSESDAIEKTLTELGHPTNVSAGMARLYTLPVVAGSGMVLAMCCALVVVLLNGSTAQTLQMSNIFPTDGCLEAKEATLIWYCNQGGWTTIDTLKGILEPQGVTFKKTDTHWVVTFPEGTPAVLGTSFQKMSVYKDETNQPVTLNAQPDYIHIRDFITSLRFTNLPVSIKGWENPTVTVGNTTFQIDLTTFVPETIYDDPPYTSKDFYSEPILLEIFNSMQDSKTYWSVADFQSTATEAKRLSISNEGAGAYGLIVIMDSSKVTYLIEDFENTEARFFDVSHADANGKLEFRSPLNQKLSFQSDLGQMQQVGDALLVRLSGDLTNTLGYVIIPPDQITLE